MFGMTHGMMMGRFHFPWFFIIILLFFILFFLRFLRKEKNKGHKKENHVIPQLTKDKEDHYKACGLSSEEIEFFRETMAQAKEQIIQLEKNISASGKLRAIDLRNHTLKACKSSFQQLVENPQKLHLANHFLYTHLPNLVSVTEKFLQINEYQIKDKATFERLTETTQIIEQLSQLILKDYYLLVDEDFDDLERELSITKEALKEEQDSF